MLLHIVTIRDIQADCYSQPQYTPSIGGFIRGLADEVNSGKSESVLAKHPSDFEAWHLGTWDDNTNEFKFFDQPKSLGQLANLKITQ